MKTLWSLLLLLLVLLSLALVGAVFTPSGSRALLQVVDRYSPLEIVYAGGALSGELRLESLGVATDGLELELRNLLVELEPGCLWRSAICFRQLVAAHLEVGLLPADDSNQALPSQSLDGRDGGMLVFPLALEADALSIESVRIHWQGGEWRQGPAQLQLLISGSRINVPRATLTRAVLELNGSDADLEARTDRIGLSRINLPLELSVGELHLEQPAWHLYGAAHQLRSLELEGNWRNSDLHIAQLVARDDEWGALSLQGEIAFGGDWPLLLHSDIELAQPALWKGLHDRLFSLTAQGDLAALSLELSSQGSPNVAVEAELDVLDRQLPFLASAFAAWPQDLLLGDIPGLPAELADVRPDSPVSLSVEGSLAVQRFELHAAASGLGYDALGLTVSGFHELGKIELQQLLLRDNAGTSQLSGSGDIMLSERLSGSLKLQSSGFELPQLSDYAFGRLQGELQFSASLQDGDWQVFVADVDLNGSINNLPAIIHGYAGLGSGLLFTRSDLQAELNGALLSLQVSNDKAQPGHFELTVDDLGRWQPDSRGKIHFSTDFSAHSRQLQLGGTLEDIHWQGQSVRRGTLTGDYRVDAGQAFNLDLKLYDTELGNVQLSSLQLLAGGTVAQHVVTVLSQGDLQGDLRLTASLLEGQWNARLAPTRLHTPQGSWALGDAVALGWSAGSPGFFVEGHCWQQPRVQFCPGDLQWAEQASGSLSVSGDMDFLAGLMPSGVDVKGEIQLDLAGAWDPAVGLTVNGQSQTRSVVLTRHYGEAETASLGWDRGDMAIDYSSEGLNLQWQVQRSGRNVIGLDVLLPPERQAPLRGTASLDSLQLESLAPFVPRLSMLEGGLSGQLQLSGTVDKPLAQGRLNLSAGKLALAGNPTLLESLDVQFDLLGDRAQLNGKGLLGGGELRFTGAISSQPEWRLAMSVSGEKHLVLYPPSTELLVSETLEVVAGGNLLDINGDLEVLEGTLEPEELSEGSVAISADVVEVDYAGNVIREELPFDVSLDVRVQVRDRFRVAGSILQATLGGNLQLQQRPKSPLQLFGNLNLVGGELNAYQQRLLIKRGTFSFTGRPDNPALDVRAQREISGSNVVAGVQVQGTLDELRLEVFSEPAMSQGEAMSYLVRGRGLDATAGSDGTALALSLASGVVNRSSIVSELNRIPGVSNVTFGADGSAEDTAATVSGYIGERIYLSYGFGLYEPINVLAARFYLRSRLWLEVISSLENSMDLYYSFDID